MKIAISLLLLSLSLSFQSCKSTANRGEVGAATDNSPDAVTGTMDDKNQMVIPVPSGLPTVPTTSSSKATVIPQSSQVSGLGLAEQTNIKTFSTSRKPVGGSGEGISSACYSIDTRFPNANWHFYAEAWLGTTFIQGTDASIENCGDIQVSLANLRKDKKYKVSASIYYHMPNTNRDIVWYEGTTANFTPGDREITLVLKKLLQDQKINIEYQKSAKEQCNIDGYFWNGYDCLNRPKAVVFEYTSTASMADSTTAKKQKCMEISDHARLQQCTFDPQTQLVTMHFYQKGIANQGPGETEESTKMEWYYVTVGQDSTGAAGVPGTNALCLTSDPRSGTAAAFKIIKAPCKFDEEGKVHDSQLFTLAPASPEDNAGLNAFRVSSMYQTRDPRCFGIPPDSNIKGGLPFHDNATIVLVSCATQDINLRYSQFVRFVGKEDYGNIKSK